MLRYLLAIILILTLLQGAFGEEVPVRIKADNMDFNQHDGLITAHGSVEIDFEDIIIYSDHALVDTNANVATAEGRVKVKRKDYSITSQSVTYDISSETAVVINLRTVFYPTDVRANLYVAAERIRELDDAMLGDNGSLTTCDYDEPHYNIKARWFDYYPDDKLVAYIATMYAGQVPIFMVPYYVYNLKTRKSPYTFIYGQNEVEGRFLKTSYDYFITNSAYGELYIDSTEIKGPGYGFKHRYILDQANSGTLYAYHMYEQDTHITDRIIDIAHTYKPDPFSSLSLTHNTHSMYRIPSGRRNDTSSSIGYSRKTAEHGLNFGFSSSDDWIGYNNSRAFNISNSYQGMNTSFRWDESKRLSGQKTKTSHDYFSHSQSLFTDDLRISTNINYTSYVTDEGAVADERMDPLVEMTYKGAFYNVKLTQQWYVDVDGRKYRADSNLEYLEKLPELTVTFNPIDLKVASLTSSIGYAQYHEAKYIPTFLRMRHLTTERYSASVGLSRVDQFGFGTRLTTGLGLDQYSYETGDQRYRFSESARLDTDLGGFFRNNVDWGRARTEGATPFFFESLGSQHNYIRDTITLYYMNQVNFNVSGGYNYMNSTYYDVTTGLRITPSQVFSTSINTGWSIEQQRYLDLNISATVTPWPKFYNTASLNYDMNIGFLRSANSMIDLEIGDTWEDRWHFKLGHSYDMTLDRYMLRDLAIIKDLHCWQAIFTYNDWRKEYRFGMSLNAFPSFPIGYVAGESGNYVDGFMNNLSFEQASPQR